MKIVRLKKGYRITCSDSEFAALQDLTTRGEGELEGLEDGDWKDIDPAVRRGLKTVTGAGSWSLHEDRR